MQVINLRTLKPIDRDTIVNSVKKTHRVISAEEGWPQSGVGAEIIAMINEEAFVSPSQSWRNHAAEADLLSELLCYKVAMQLVVLKQP